nr:TnsA endonuclease N-terminal domain-containing protein [Paenibacillus sp. CFBP 13594]
MFFVEKNQGIKYHPIKILRSKKYGNNYWTSRGNKVNKRNIELYSDLEFDHWLTVETNPDVLTYCEQPLKISYVLKGQLRTSIFDMWTLNQDGKETFVEVKYEKELTSNHPKYDRTKRQIEAQQEWCRLNHKAYEVRTEKTIRRGRHSIENRKSIVTAVLNSEMPACISDVLARITVRNKKIQEIIKEISCFKAEDVNLALKWLYYTGNLTVDIENQIWGSQMEVCKNE